MFLKHADSGHLVQVLDIATLTNPFANTAEVQFQNGEELQDPEAILKDELVFPSGESLPRCWLDSHYRDEEVFRH